MSNQKGHFPVRNRLHRIATSPFAADIKRYGCPIGFAATVPIALVINVVLRDFVWVAA